MESSKELTVNQTILYIGRGYPGAIGLLKTVIQGRPACLNIEPIEEEASEIDYTRMEISNVDSESMKVSGVVPANSAEAKDIAFEENAPPPIELTDLLSKHVNESIQRVNSCYILLAMEKMGLTGQNIEKYYVNGCKENIILFNLSLFLATMNGDMTDIIQAAIKGDHDMSQHINFTAKAAADANNISMENNMEEYGAMSLEEIRNKELETGKYKELTPEEAEKLKELEDGEDDDHEGEEWKDGISENDDFDIKPFFDSDDSDPDAPEEASR